LCLLAWIETDPSSDQQHWGWIKVCLGVRSSISAGLTIAANVAIATGTALLGAPRSLV